LKSGKARKRDAGDDGGKGLAQLKFHTFSLRWRGVYLKKKGTKRLGDREKKKPRRIRLNYSGLNNEK